MTEGKWVASHAYKYGFIIRYPNNTESTVGYIYEPWHIRYVGEKLAAELHRQNDPPLETFFGLSGAPTY
jgi:D-alanyl-D-alanine carboxypeptidase